MKKWMLCLVWLLLMCGCRSAKDSQGTMPIDTVYIDKYTDRVRIDSVYCDRWHVIEQKGDTVWLRDSVVAYRYRMLRDTVTNIQYYKEPYIVSQEVVKVKKVYMWWPSIVVLAAVCVWFFSKKRKDQ